jgi:hypothetical protein
MFRVEKYAKQDSSKKQATSNGLLLIGFLRGLLFDPKGEGNMFLQNVG